MSGLITQCTRGGRRAGLASVASAVGIGIIVGGGSCIGQASVEADVEESGGR